MTSHAPPAMRSVALWLSIFALLFACGVTAVPIDRAAAMRPGESDDECRVWFGGHSEIVPSDIVGAAVRWACRRRWVAGWRGDLLGPLLVAVEPRRPRPAGPRRAHHRRIAESHRRPRRRFVN